MQIEYLKADSAELVQRRAEITDLNALVGSQRVTIKNITSHVQTLDLRLSNKSTEVELLSRALKKQKRRTITAKVAGIGVTASLAFLLIAFK